MREFREIDDVEDKLRNPERVTHEEAREYMKKHNKSLEESKVETDEVSSETEYERTKREIREYIDTVEDFEKLMNKIISSISENPLKTDNLEIDRIKIRDGTSEVRVECSESLEEAKAEKVETSSETGFEKLLDEQEGTEVSTEYSVNMSTPRINDERIKSYEHLLDTLHRSYSGFFNRHDSSILLKQAEIHLMLFKEYSTKKFLPRGEIANIAERTGKSPTAIKRWLREGVEPRLYYWINKVSLENKMERIESLRSSLNGSDNIERMNARFNTLYFKDEIEESPNHRPNHEYAIRYFQFLEEYSKGGLLIDITRELEIGKTTMGEWLKGSQIPTRVKYASLIPSEVPESGMKWLPIKLNHLANIPEHFIQVPLEIATPQDLQNVLGQLTSETSELAHDLGRYGEGTIGHDFMYLLGLVVSDGSFPYDVTHSAKLQLYASKKYLWSKELGVEFCEIIHRMGFTAEQKSDDTRIKDEKQMDCRVWGSEASPVFMWMKKTLLGLDASSIKKELPIEADWILKMPREWRIAFIQGLSDGDGSASIKAFSTSIATVTNQTFFMKLLSSVGIKSTFQDTKVEIALHNEILKAQSLPLFRYASGRQEKLNDLSEIVRRLDRGYVTAARNLDNPRHFLEK